jgi:hypothetical protein
VKIDKRFLMLDDIFVKKDDKSNKKDIGRKSSENSSMAELSDQKNIEQENSDYQDMFAKQ